MAEIGPRAIYNCLTFRDMIHGRTACLKYVSICIYTITDCFKGAVNPGMYFV